MATADELTARIAGLEEIKASGVLRLKWQDREETYRSMDEIDRALADARNQLAQLAGSRVKQFVGVSCKGF